MFANDKEWNDSSAGTVVPLTDNRKTLRSSVTTNGKIIVPVHGMYLSKVPLTANRKTRRSSVAKGMCVKQ